MDDCIFCKIANKEIPTTLVYEDDLVAAFNDLSPQAPVHVLIVPKKHYQSVLEVPEGDAIVAHKFHVASKLAKELGIAENGFRLVINTGKDGGQSVPHLHLHMTGGRSTAGQRVSTAVKQKYTIIVLTWGASSSIMILFGFLCFV